jgi:transcriptional regulator with XRE-family HTH domain
MEVDQDLERITGYMRGIMTGDRLRLDAIERREMEALRRRPLADFLAELAAARLKIRGARGNEIRDVLDLLASVMTQYGVSKAELARRSLISRGHIGNLFKDGGDPRPTMETTVRIAVALEYPLSVVAHDNRGDDADVSPPRSSSPQPKKSASDSSSRTAEPTPASPRAASVPEPRPPQRTYREGFIKGSILGAVGTAVVGVLVFLGFGAKKGGAR